VGDVAVVATVGVILGGAGLYFYLWKKASAKPGSLAS